MDNKQIQQIENRTTRYWFEDGLVDISVSMIFWLLALYFYLKVILPANSPLNAFLEAGFILFVVGGSFLTSRLVNTLKERITYPRTGYVAYQQDKHQKRSARIIAVIAVAAIVAIVTLLFALNQTEVAWMPAITGLLLGIATLVFIAPRIGLLRIYLLGLAALLLGPVITLLGFENIPGLALYYALAAAGLLLSGSLTLVNYLRSTQEQGGSDD